MTKKTYPTGDWHGQPNYECSACGFSSLDEVVMEYHQATQHAEFPDAPNEVRAHGHPVDPVLVGEAGAEQFTPEESK